MNELVGERLSIITSKAQTTRHRIMGIVNEEDYQVVFSDTPGVVNAAYKLHDTMMSYVKSALRDADVLLFITDIFEDEMNHKETLASISKTDTPVLLLINKVDLGDDARIVERVAYWHEKVPNAQIIPISALHNFNLEFIWQKIVELIPEGPAYYDKDSLTDRPVRFFVSEIIREAIFENLKKEIPYSTQVEIESFEEGEKLTRIRALIIVERDTQKGIIIGHKGEMLKRIGMQARKGIEKFIDSKVFLETYVKVDKNWRSSDKKLKDYGY
jgi:GTP-binding protein Era